MKKPPKEIDESERGFLSSFLFNGSGATVRMVRFHLYNMAAINPATIENADPDKCANAPFTPQPGEKRKALKSRDFKDSRLVENRGVEPLTSTMRMSRADEVFVLTPQLLQ